QIIPSGNRMFIRPLQSGVSTNMTVISNRHSYQFDLKSSGMEEKDSQNIYVAKFTYPEDRPKYNPPPPAPMPPPPPHMAPPPSPPHMPPPPPVEPVAEPVVEKDIMPPARTNYNYTYSGPDVLAP